jgi:hypothetical protein
VHHGLDRDGGGLVAGGERGGVDGGAVRRDRERARRVGEQGDLGQPRATRGGAEVRGVEHPDVGAADACGLQVVRVGRVLAAVRAGDEAAIAVGAGEDDVARFVADEEGAHDAGVVAVVVELDDADGVGEVVDHPDLAAVAHGDRDGLEADRHRRDGRHAGAANAEDLEPVVRRVDGEQEPAICRQGDGANM